MRTWLKKLREKNKMTQSVVSNLMGLTQQSYSNIESGKRQVKMPIETVKKLSEIFGVSIEYILEQECK